MTITFPQAQAVLDAQPFSRLLQARLTAFEPGTATIELDVRDELRQQAGVLHGGVLAYAADNVVTFAGGSVLGPAVLTGGVTISYLQPVRHGTLRAVAQVAHHTRRQAVCTAELWEIATDGTTRRCAVAQGTVVATSAPA